MTSRTKKRLTREQVSALRDSAEWRRKALIAASRFSPPVYPCGACGEPVVDGYCCNACGDANPKKLFAP